MKEGIKIVLDLVAGAIIGGIALLLLPILLDIIAIGFLIWLILVLAGKNRETKQIYRFSRSVEKSVGRRALLSIVIESLIIFLFVNVIGGLGALIFGTLAFLIVYDAEDILEI